MKKRRKKRNPKNLHWFGGNVPRPPRFTMNKLAEYIEDMQSVVILVNWKDGTHQVSYSTIKGKDFIFLMAAMQKEALAFIEDN